MKAPVVWRQEEKNVQVSERRLGILLIVFFFIHFSEALC